MNWVAHLENKIATNKKAVCNLIKYVVYFKKCLSIVKLIKNPLINFKSPIKHSSSGYLFIQAAAEVLKKMIK